MLKVIVKIILYFSEAQSLVEAGVNGALIAGKTVATVVVSFIGFLSLLEYVDTFLGWSGDKVGYPNLSYQVYKQGILNFLDSKLFTIQ